MVKTRSALLIEGDSFRQVTEKLNEYVNADDSSWEVWESPGEDRSGGYYAMLILKSTINDEPTGDER